MRFDCTVQVPGGSARLILDQDIVGKDIHLHSIIPPHGNKMTPEIIDLAFDCSTVFGVHNPLMAAYIAFCLTTLWLPVL